MKNQYLYLRGTIDTHVHSSPDIRERKMSDYELMEAAVACKARGIVIKSHALPTVARAADINEICHEKYGDFTDFEMFGGITLNHYAGGLNPWAVEAALKMGGKIVWMPTFHSQQAVERAGKGEAVVCVRQGRVVEELKSILQLIKDYDATVATSHLSPSDIFCVVEESRNMGIQKIIISHPESNLVGLTLEEQKRLANEYDVMLERCYAQPVGGGKYLNNLEDTYHAVQEIGAKNIIIATDAGQIQNPYWYESFHESIAYLADKGIGTEELEQMTKINPASMLGI